MNNIIDNIMNNILNYFNYSIYSNNNNNKKKIEENLKLMFCNCEKNNFEKNNFESKLLSHNNLFGNIYNDFKEINLYIDNNL
jgi:hypothetical protein